jgi:Domain of unknown function (DUF4191)
MAIQGKNTKANPTASRDKATDKAAKKAEKARKKASSDPADMGRFRQIWQAYQVTHQQDRALPWLLLGCFLLPVIAFWAFHFVWNHPVYLTFLGISVGVLLALLMLVRRGKQAAYKRYAGQAGSAEVALRMLPKQWISTPVVAFNRQQDMIHRTLGPGGLVLIGEGDSNRVRQLLASEVRKHERVAYGVTVTTIVMGNGEGQVPLEKLTDHIRNLPKSLKADQVTDLKMRLRALDAVRPKLPAPKGPLPTNPRQIKGVRQSMRGR